MTLVHPLREMTPAQHTDRQLPRTLPEGAFMLHTIADQTTVSCVVLRDPDATSLTKWPLEMLGRNEEV